MANKMISDWEIDMYTRMINSKEGCILILLLLPFNILFPFNLKYELWCIRLLDIWHMSYIFSEILLWQDTEFSMFWAVSGLIWPDFVIVDLLHPFIIYSGSTWEDNWIELFTPLMFTSLSTVCEEWTHFSCFMIDMLLKSLLLKECCALLMGGAYCPFGGQISCPFRGINKLSFLRDKQVAPFDGQTKMPIQRGKQLWRDKYIAVSSENKLSLLRDKLQVILFGKTKKL